MISLSIVVAVYNTEKYLARCLDSLVFQDIPPDQYEIIVINDGSPDDSASVVRDYMSSYPQIVYFEQANLGLFETRNKGINLARGKYIYFVDSDDFIAQNALGSIVRFMELKDLDVFGFGIVKTFSSTIPSAKTNEKSFNSAVVYNGPDYISNFDFPKESVWLVINKNFLLIHKITYLKGNAFSDGLFTTETLYHAKRMVIIPNIIYAYFQHSGSILHSASTDHYRALLKRYEATSRDFTRFRKKIQSLNTLQTPGMERIKSKEISYIFFMLARVVKSDLSLKEIDEVLNRLSKDEYYPIKGFIGKDYNGIAFRILVFIFNNRFLFYPSVIAYRALARLRSLF